MSKKYKYLPELAPHQITPMIQFGLLLLIIGLVMDLPLNYDFDEAIKNTTESLTQYYGWLLLLILMGIFAFIAHYFKNRCLAISQYALFIMHVIAGYPFLMLISGLDFNDVKVLLIFYVGFYSFFFGLCALLAYQFNNA